MINCFQLRHLWCAISFFYLLLFLFVGSAHAQWVQTSLDSCNVTCLAVSGTNLLAGTNSSLSVSSDNGTNWTEVGFQPVGAGTLFVSGMYLFAAANSGGGVFLSTNNGLSWTYAGTSNIGPDAFAISDTNLFGGTSGNGVFLSTNNGTSWTAVNTGLTNTIVWSLAVSGTNLFAGTDGGGVFLSANNGTSWKAVNTGLTCAYVLTLMVSDTNLFAGTPLGVYLSTNNGASWAHISSGMPRNIFVYSLVVSGTNLFAGTNTGGVFLSSDNGTSWTAVDSGLTSFDVRSLIVFGPDLFAGTLYDGGVWRRPLSEMITSVKQHGSDIPREYTLRQNYPNPFNPSSTISYSLPQKTFVTLKLYDLLGREVRTIVNGEQEPGNHSRIVDASAEGGLPSGVYFYRLQAGKFTDSKKMVLLK